MAAPDDPIAAARAFTEALNAMAAELAAVKAQAAEHDAEIAETKAAAGELGRYGRTNRRRILVLTAAIVPDLILTAVGVWAVVRANGAHDTADQARASQVQTCLASNVTRAQNAQLWDFVVDLAEKSTTAPQTPQRRAQLTAFRAEIQRVFAPRDCSKI